MPIEYHLDLELSAVIAEAKGVMCDDDLIDYARRLKDDSEAGSVSHELVDMTRAEAGSEISGEGIRRVAAFWADAYDTMSGHKLALVAPVDLSFGLSRMYQGLRDDGPDHIRVFRDRDEACRWLREEGPPSESSS